MLKRKSRLAWLVFFMGFLLLLASCGSDNDAPPAAVQQSTGSTTYSAIYNGNGATGGSAPSDSNSYAQGQTVTVLGNTGSLVKTGCTFAGWNTKADGSGTTYTQNQTFTMGAANATLYAIWIANKYAYVANYYGGTVSQYTIGADGSLAPMSTPTVTAGADAESIAANPTGKYVYVANYGDNTVSQYTIGADGSLTPMSAPTVAAGTVPDMVVIHPSGKYAYVGNYNSGNVSQYTIGADGSLTPMSTPAVAAGTSPESLAVDPSGKYVYVPNCDSNNVSQYTIGAEGSLTPMSTPTVAESTGPVAVATVTAQ